MTKEDVRGPASGGTSSVTGAGIMVAHYGIEAVRGATEYGCRGFVRPNGGSHLNDMQVGSTVGERYDVLGEFGRGAFSTVYKVLDRVHGKEMALKLLERLDDSSRIQFRREHWLLQRLDHPGLVKALDYGIFQNRPYFTMEAIDGAIVPVSGRFSAQELRELLEPICQILAYLHREGLVHGDLKPQNLRYDERRQLRLLDLGFAQEAGRPGRQRGTLAYMPAEVITGQPCDPRSDLFSLSAIAYQLLADQSPFPATTPLELLQKQTTTPPPRLETLRPDIPADWCLALTSCLERDLAKRQASADHLLESLGWAPRSGGYLTFGADLFGRERDLSIIKSRLIGQGRLSCSSLLVRGDHGTGRTRLMRETAAIAWEHGDYVIWLSGGLDRPFALVESLVTEVLAVFEADSNGSDQILSDRRLEPVLALTGKSAANMPLLEDPRNQNLKLRLSVATLLETLAQHKKEAGQALVIMVDDWDAADRASRDLLIPLIARPGDETMWLLSGIEERIEIQQTVSLGPLSQAAVEAFVRAALAGEPPGNLAKQAHTLSQGNPVMLRKLLEHWTARNTLYFENGRWHLVENGVADLPEEVSALWRPNISALDMDSLDLARLGAILGPTFALADVERLAPELDLFSGVMALKNSLIVETQGDQCRFLGGCQEAILSDLPAREFQKLHLRATGLYIEASDLKSQICLARHHVAAGSAEATMLVLGASRAGLSAGAIDTSYDLLRTLEEKALSPSDLVAVHALKGDISRAQGRMAASLDQYQRALDVPEGAGDKTTRCKALCGAGRSAMGLSQFAQARLYIDQALPLAIALEEANLQGHCFITLARVAFFEGDLETAREFGLQAHELGAKRHLRSLEVRALSFLGAIAPPGDAEGKRSLEEAAAIQRSLDDAWGLVDALINLADRRTASGELELAETALIEARNLARQVGIVGEEAFAEVNLAQLELERGWPGAALSHALRARELATRVGQDVPKAFGQAFAALAQLELGQFSEARIEAHASLVTAERLGNKYLEAWALQATGEISLELGELDAACHAFERASPLCQGDLALELQLDLLQCRFLLALGAWDDAHSELELVFDRATQGGLGLIAARACHWLAQIADLKNRPEAALQLAGRAMAAAESHHSAGLAARSKALEASIHDRMHERDLAVQRYHAVLEYALEARIPILEGIASLALGRLESSPKSLALRKRGLEILRNLRSYTGSDGQLRWYERQISGPGDARATNDQGWAQDVVAIIQTARQAATWQSLMDAVLGILCNATRASRGALLGYRDRQLWVTAAVGVDALHVASMPLIEQVTWEVVQSLEAQEWALPITDQEDLLAVVYLAGEGLTQKESLPDLLDAATEAFVLFRDLHAIMERSRNLQVSVGMASRLVAAGSQDERFTAALGILLEATGAERAFLLTPEGENDFRVVGSATQHGAPLTGEAPVSRSVCRYVCEARELVSLLDAQGSEAWQTQESIASLGLRSIFAAPLLNNDQLLGILYLDSANVLSNLGGEARDLLEEVCRMLGSLVQGSPSLLGGHPS